MNFIGRSIKKAGNFYIKLFFKVFICDSIEQSGNNEEYK